MIAKLLYFVSHPIQYQAPLLRRIDREEDINLRVIFTSDFSSQSYFDDGFGSEVAWDIPLREGYDSQIMAEIDPEQAIAESDVVWFHGWQDRRYRQLVRYAKSQSKPVLMRGENWSGAMPDGSFLKGWLKRRYLAGIFDGCSAFLAIGTANRNYYLDHDVPKQTIFDMPYAVNNDFFAERATAEAAMAFRQEIGVPENQPIILFAGKFSTRKRPEVLLDAWDSAAWQSDQKPALVFVGDGEMKGNLQSRAQRSANAKDIYFAGFRNQTELPAIYKAADIFVLASEKEAWGLALNEAMASGTAVIASDECGAALDLVDQSTGAVVEAGNVAALTSALVDLLPRAAEAGKAAQKRIADWDFEADVVGLKASLDFCLGGDRGTS